MQFIVALNFAELSSHFPVAGSVYQWTKYLSGRGYAWFTGWFYLIAGILTVASVCATLPLALFPMLNKMFGWNLTRTSRGAADQASTALITLSLITVLNIYGVRIVAIVNNTGVFFEVLGMVVFALFLAFAHDNQGLGVIFDADKTGNIFEFPAPVSASFFLVAMFMSLYVIYGFDTASTLAEETHNPRQEAPKAVLASVIGAFVIGAVFLWGVLIAVPDMGEAVAGSSRPAGDHRRGALGRPVVLYLLVVVASIFVCCMAILTSTIRLAFGMARDNQLPFSKTMSKVSPRLHTPVATCIIIGLLAAIPFIQFAGRGLDRDRGDGVDLPQLPAREPRGDASAHARVAEDEGAVLARRVGEGREPRRDPVGRRDARELPDAVSERRRRSTRDASGANYLRIFANPKPIQTDYYVEGEQLVDFKIGFLNEIPVIWTVFGVVIIVGAIYYFAVQRKKPYEAVVIPEPRSRGSLRLASLVDRTGAAEAGPSHRVASSTDEDRRLRRAPPSTSRNTAARYGSGSIRTVGSSAPTSGSRRIANHPRTARQTRFTRSSRRPHRFRSSSRGLRAPLRLRQLDPPDELHLDLKGWRNGTRRLEAYWNGCVFVGTTSRPPGGRDPRQARIRSPFGSHRGSGDDRAATRSPKTSTRERVPGTAISTGRYAYAMLGADRVADAAGRHPGHDAAVPEHRLVTERHRPRPRASGTRAGASRRRPGPLERLAADEPRLVHRDREPQPGLERRVLRRDVRPPRPVPLLEAERIDRAVAGRDEPVRIAPAATSVSQSARRTPPGDTAPTRARRRTSPATRGTGRRPR